MVELVLIASAIRRYTPMVHNISHSIFRFLIINLCFIYFQDWRFWKKKILVSNILFYFFLNIFLKKIRVVSKRSKRSLRNSLATNGIFNFYVFIEIHIHIYILNLIWQGRSRSIREEARQVLHGRTVRKHNSNPTDCLYFFSCFFLFLFHFVAMMALMTLKQQAKIHSNI